MPDTSHTTEPYGDSTLHYWELRGPCGAVSLSAVELTNPGAVAAITARFNALKPLLAGAFVFDVAQLHRNCEADSDWPCSRHGDTCDMDAFVSSVALPKWQRAVAAGLTDEAVFAELQPLYAVEFGQVSL
jgi:hypothetical protein